MKNAAIRVYRGFEIHWPVGAPGLLVRDPAGEFTKCDEKLFHSNKQAEKYIDAVIKYHCLSKPDT
jgi:hypothetical protein